MKRIIIMAVLVLFSWDVYAEEAQNMTVPAPEKYAFKLYVLAKGMMKKNNPRPDFGWRVLKAFPLKVREFTYPAPYMDSGAAEFKAAVENILASIEEPRRKNAVRVTDAVFEYINISVTAREVMEETTETPHKLYYSALQSLKAAAGNNLEKCRLAAAMLRYFTIPARIVSREGAYEVEYYIQPLTEQGKGAWYLKNFDGAGPADGEYYVPANWHPIDAKELLSEEWQGPMFIKLKQQKRSFMSADDVEAQAIFASLTQTGKNIMESVNPEKGAFYTIDELDYELWLQPGNVEAKAEFTLPFNLEDQLNIKDDFKTVKYFVESSCERLAVKSKWPQTRTKPSQEGIIYTLPVSFSVKNVIKISN